MRKLVHATCQFGAAAGLLLGSAARAQQAPVETPPADSRGGQLEEITVTARRVEENLQNVPTAVTALTRQDLQDLQINGFQELAGTAPNVNIQKQAGSPIAPQFNIRGVTTGNLDLQSDAGIGLYIDGVYIGRPSASGFDMADLERVEVLRGPQGTLFGRNATGGAISITTAAPTGEFDLHGDVGFGNYQERKQKVSLDLPAWNGFAVRVTLGHDEHGGYVTNTAPPVTYQFSAPFGSYTTSSSFGDSDNNTVLAAVRYTGIDKLTVDYKYDYTNWIGTMDGRQLLSTSPGFIAETNFPQQPQNGGTAVVSLDRLSAFPSNFDSPSTARIFGHSLTAQYFILDNLTVKNIAAYREEHQRVGLNNLDGNAFVDPSFATTDPYTTLGALRIESQHQVSDELQLLGDTGPVTWITGLFYFDEKGAVNNPVALGALSGPWSTTSINAITPLDYIAGMQAGIDNRSQAAYAHAVWHLDQFDFAGGVRYTQDNRSETVFNDYSTLIGAITPGTEFNYTGTHTDYDFEGTYKIDPDKSLYAKTASGFISGGITNGLKFAAETIKSYELGFKSDLLGNTLRFNTALFYQDRAHLQVLGFTAPPGTFIFDGGKEKDSGVEIETTYVPMAGLTFDGSFGYTNTNNESGVRSFQPRYTGGLGSQYVFTPLPNGALPKFRIDASYRSDQYRLPCEAGVAEDPKLGCQVKPTDTPDPTLDKQLVLKGEVTLGARLSLTQIPFGGEAKGTVSLWVQNLLDNKEFAYLFPVSGVQTVGTFDNPRTFGIDFNVDL